MCDSGPPTLEEIGGLRDIVESDTGAIDLLVQLASERKEVSGAVLVQTEIGFCCFFGCRKKGMPRNKSSLWTCGGLCSF